MSIFQALTMVVVFCLTLASGVVSKGATMFMVSQVAANVTRAACPERFSYFSFTIPGTVYGVQLTQTEKVGWLWAIFFCYLASEVFTFIRCCRVVFMKSFRKVFKDVSINYNIIHSQ